MPRIIDADSHTVEPPDLWVENLEPEYRHRAMRIAVDENGLEYLEIDGKKPTGYLISGGMFGRPSGIGKDVKDLLTPGKITYQEGLEPGAVDPIERLKVLDSEGIEATVLYPTMGLAWEAECPDYKLAAAYCRVYNDWILDFCRPNPDRLIPIAHISVSDADEGAKELERTAEIGARGVFLSGYPINGVSYGDPRHDQFWGIAQESDLAVSLHIAATPRQVFDNLYTGGVPENTWWNFLTLANDTFIGFASLFKGAVFDRFPDIKIIVLETGAGFMPYWLDRMDEFYEKFRFATGMQMKPSDYFYKQCWISLEPDDEMAVATINVLGADRFIWGADYPHSDGLYGAVDVLKNNISPLSEADQAKVLGENAIELYNIGPIS